ncbi:MAG: glycosyltransferase family 1 protein, partial [Merismopedia sp. SIO2A8]|nr:glycosyltransferase family 1 protein [Merismopedia sp. SIO2A8]
MRIFIAVRHSINPKFFFGDLWSRNFYPALQQLGHEIIESQVDLLPASRFMQVPDNFTRQEQEVRSQLTQKIIDEVTTHHKKKPIDLFLSYFYNSHFDPLGFEAIHTLGIPTINFYCNSIYQFSLVSSIAAKVKFSWHSEKNAEAKYTEVGAQPVWVQMGADPKIYYPVKETKRVAKACFVGQRYADRDRLLAHLIHHQVPLNIFGSGWGKPHAPIQQASTNAANPLTRPLTHQATNDKPQSYLGRPILKPGSLQSYCNLIKKNIVTEGFMGGMARTISQVNYRAKSNHLNSTLESVYQGFAESMIQAFSQHELILNFSHVWADGRPGSTLIPHVRLRDFEAPMSRACYLTGHTEEIGEFYTIGTEIDTYKTVDELVDKARFYLNNPYEAEKMREAGYQRSLREHTWKRFFQV